MRSPTTMTAACIAISTLASACGSPSFSERTRGPDASTGGGAGQSGTGGASAGGASSGGSTGKGGGGASSGGSAGKGGGGGAATGGATGASGAGGTPGGAGADAGDGGDGGSTCDERKSPAVEPCLATNEHAVFVAPGATPGDGTKEHPATSIANAMVIAKGANLTRIIVCNATYLESVAITQTTGALSLYGGFTCPVASGDAGADWTPTPGVHAIVAPTDGVPLTINGSKSKIIVSGIDFIAADAKPAATGESGKSSIGGIVANSTDVTLLDVTLTAGKGSDGSAGADGVKGTDGADPSMAMQAKAASCSGQVPDVQPGGTWGAPSSCNSSGGDGGKARKAGQGDDGQAGVPQTKVDPPGVKNGGAAALAAGADNEGASGTRGSDGALGTNGVSASAGGSFTAAAYTPADGVDGSDGQTGQGGGGGGAASARPGALARAAALAAWVDVVARMAKGAKAVGPPSP